MNWAVLELGKPFSSLSCEDLLAYGRFLANPQPAERWIMSGKKFGRNHPEWRPFAAALTPNTVRHALVVLNVCFAWLTNAGYLGSNPLWRAPGKRTDKRPPLTRYFNSTLWADVKETIEHMPLDTERERKHAVRSRWLFTVLYLGGLRVSEVTALTMGAFFRCCDAKGIERWWLEVTEKDGTRLVPATDEVMVELTRYRLAHGLSALPFAGETVPLIVQVIGHEKSLTRGALHVIVKDVFRRTAERIRAQGPEGAARAAVVESASAQWTRHTALVRMGDQHRDVRHLCDTFGLTSIARASSYLDSEDNVRHDAFQELHRIDWND
ncbi:integrase [Paraburkholderia sp. SIMBA_049]